MAICPNCGSEHITLKQETNVSWGRAVVGWALLGPVAGAVGAVTGEDRTVNACLDCGESWKAKELYGVLGHIRELIRVDLDLRIERDRRCLQDYVKCIPPSYFEQSKAITAADKRFRATRYKDDDGKKYAGIVVGSLTGFMLLGMSQGNMNTYLSCLIIFACGYIAYGLVPANQKTKQHNEEIAATAKERRAIEVEAAKAKKAQTVEGFQRTWSKAAIKGAE
jgi:hypothetical protein